MSCLAKLARALHVLTSVAVCGSDQSWHGSCIRPAVGNMGNMAQANTGNMGNMGNMGNTGNMARCLHELTCEGQCRTHKVVIKRYVLMSK